ncbi:YbjN domain-containing protein [Nostoc sp.]|uniref:YbjN domain-containing protein n=1 Tax=Nostoc sp. TaxID=1180 RepID=UPI002FF006AE
MLLSVKQQQQSGSTGYRTVWSYVNPKALSEEASSGAEISEAITNFFKDVVGSSLDMLAKEFSNESQGIISNFFPEIAQNIPESTPQNTSTQPIFQALVNFFPLDDWSFTRIQGEQVLHLGFQGENGKWNSYAQAREKQEQLVFYSNCPLLAPENKRGFVANFITRANYSMIIGNFEMDFDDGEIRYKSSIDIDGDQLTSDIIKRLVYANVTIMDEYLPGIIAVIEKDVSPVDAITQIE